MGRWLPRGLALAGVAWCVGLGIWLWVTPVRYEGVGSSAYADSNDTVQQATYRFTSSQSFADGSLLGPVPLIIPVLLAVLCAWAVWRGRMVPAAIAAGLLILFVFLAGFSIGPGYLPAAVALVWALASLADV